MNDSTARLTANDLPALFDEALNAAHRAVVLNRSYVCPVRRKGHIFFIASSWHSHGFTVALDDDPVTTAQNALYCLVYGWAVDFTAADVDDFIAGGREL